jgi:MFS family permease
MVTLWMINEERQGQTRSQEENRAAREKKSEGAMAELAEGWRVTRSNPVALSSVLMYGWIWGVIGGFFALLTAIIFERLAPMAGISVHEKILVFQGRVIALVGVAMFIGGVVVGMIAGRVSLSRVLTYSFLGAGLTIALLGLPGVMSNIWLPVGLFFLLGAFGGMILIPVETAIGKGVPREIRGRVFAFNTVFHTILLTGMMTLTNIYLTKTKGMDFRLELAMLVIGVFAVVGGLFTRWLPKGVSLAELTPDTVSIKA